MKYLHDKRSSALIVQTKRDRVKELRNYFNWWQLGVNPVVDEERGKFCCVIEQWQEIIRKRQQGLTFRAIGEELFPYLGWETAQARVRSAYRLAVQAAEDYLDEVSPR